MSSKARTAIESLFWDAVVTQVAQRHGCRVQQIHEWRRLARTGRLALPAPNPHGVKAAKQILGQLMAEAGSDAADVDQLVIALWLLQTKRRYK